MENLIDPGIILPVKFSDWLQMALDDLEACERDPNYKVFMGTWHSPQLLKDDKGRLKPMECHVCLAGSVMAQRLRVSPTKYITPSGFIESLHRALWALSAVVFGGTEHGLYWYYGKPILSREYEAVDCHYGANPEQFKSELRDVIADLRGCGY